MAKQNLKAKPLLVAEELADESSADQKRAQSVRNYAVALAKGLGTSVDLAHVEDISLYPLDRAHYRLQLQRYLASQQKRLKKLSQAMPVPTRPLFQEGTPTEALQKLATERDDHGGYELIVQGTHGRTGVRRLLLGSVAEEVIRNSKIPVMTVGTRAQKSPPTILTAVHRRILVATELGPNSKKAEAYALSLAQRLGAEVILVHCMYEGLHPTLQSAFSTSTGAAQLSALSRELHKDSVKKLSARERYFRNRGVKCSGHLELDLRPAGELLLAAIKRFSPSLVVLGTHGRNLVAQAFLGSTARHVVLESPVPAITVASRAR